jgi:hypothetical protein
MEEKKISLQPHLQYSFKEVKGPQGERIYSEFTSGTWLEDCEKKIRNLHPDGHALPIIISSDQLTISQRKSVHNVYLSVGLVENSERRKPGGREVFKKRRKRKEKRIILILSFLKKS